MAADDPLALPMKLRSLAADPYGLWRGGKDLFYLWSKSHARPWLDDADAYVTQQGDQHLGNIGTYLARGAFGTLGFGMVDFDDSHRSPFQLELLQGLISLRLAAQQAGLDLSTQQSRLLLDTMLSDYVAAAQSKAPAMELLADDPDVQKLLRSRAKGGYERELMDFTTPDGKFISVRATKKGEVKDVLRPVEAERADALAEGIAAAIAREPSAALFRLRTPAEVRGAIKDIALRTRSGSSGSQGLRKYFVLLERPLAGVEHDVILYVKQQIPTAAERSGAVPADPRDPGQRCAEDIVSLSDPKPFFSGWCRIGGESYWVSPREPWTKELDAEDVKSFDDLLRMARVWAVAAGATHRGPGQPEMIAARMSPGLAGELDRLATAFLKQLAADHAALAADPRVRQAIAEAEAAIEAAAESADAR